MAGCSVSSRLGGGGGGVVLGGFTVLLDVSDGGGGGGGFASMGGLGPFLSSLGLLLLFGVGTVAAIRPQNKLRASVLGMASIRASKIRENNEVFLVEEIIVESCW